MFPECRKDVESTLFLGTFIELVDREVISILQAEGALGVNSVFGVIKPYGQD